MTFSVLLDLDGTLIDSCPGILASCQAALRALGHEPDEALDVRRFIGPPLEDILQEYLWRWDIEVNFRDEKCLLGVSQAQVREPEAVRRQPACAVAAYALLLLAAHKTYGPDGLPPSVPRPKWRRREPPRRATTGLLINQLRVELWSRHLRRESLSHFSSGPSHDHNPDKPSTDLASALFYSHN